MRSWRLPKYDQHRQLRKLFASLLASSLRQFPSQAQQHQGHPHLHYESDRSPSIQRKSAYGHERYADTGYATMHDQYDQLQHKRAELVFHRSLQYDRRMDADK